MASGVSESPMGASVRRGRGLLVVGVTLALVLAPTAFGAATTVTAPSASLRPSSPLGPAPPPGEENSTPVIGVVATTPVGDLPTAIASDPQNGWVYVVNQGASDVTILSGSSVIGSVDVGQGCLGIVYDSGTGDLYVSNFRTNNVSVIQGMNRIALVPVGTEPLTAVYDPANGLVYVIDSGSNSVTILNGTTVVANDSVGAGPTSGAYDPSDGFVYVTSRYTNLEAVFSGTTVIDEISTGLVLAFDTLYDPVNGYLYVLNATEQGGRYGAHIPGALGVAIVGTRLAFSFSIGTGPQFGAVAAIDPQTGWLYIPDAGTSSVIIVNGTEVIASVDIGALPTVALYDPADSMVYISDEQGYAVTVLNLTAIVAQPTVGIYPQAMAYDPLDEHVYVANLGESTVTILGLVQGWRVQFVESGLAPGTTWNVTFESVARSSNSSTIVFFAPNGTYTYSVSPVTGYLLNNSSRAGVSTVTEPGVTIEVLFTPIVGAPPPSHAFSSVYLYYGLGGAALAALAAGGVLGARKYRKTHPKRRTVDI